MKIYIAGKIAGDRRYRAKFREAAKALEAAGHVVLNPATLPDGLTDGDYMRIALAMLEASDLAVFLPDYQESRGAMVEWAWCPADRERVRPVSGYSWRWQRLSKAQISMWEEKIVDSFAGGGGASTGIELATGGWWT